MIITCPNCATKYNIKPALLGDGCHTRCFNCGYSWFQGPVVSPPPPPMAPQPLMPPSPSFADGPTPTLAPSYGQAVSSQTEESLSEPIKLDNGMVHAEDSVHEESVSPEGTNAISESTEQLPLAESAADSDSGNEDNIDDIDPDSLPEPEPIPNVFMPNAGNGNEKKPRSLIKTILIALTAILIIVLAALVFARGVIMDFLPFTKELYATVGLGEALGEGLKIGNAKPKRATSQGKEVLIVTGVITNISDKTRSVPLIKVSIRDDQDNEVQSAISPPERSDLAAGKRMKFKVTLVNPSPLARRIEVIFAPPEKVKKTE